MSSDPELIQVKTSTLCTRLSGASPRSVRKTMTPTTKAASTVAQPTMCPIRSSSRPPSSSTIAPASGRAMSSSDAP